MSEAKKYDNVMVLLEGEKTYFRDASWEVVDDTLYVTGADSAGTFPRGGWLGISGLSESRDERVMKINVPDSHCKCSTEDMLRAIRAYGGLR